MVGVAGLNAMDLVPLVKLQPVGVFVVSVKITVADALEGAV